MCAQIRRKKRKAKTSFKDSQSGLNLKIHDKDIQGGRSMIIFVDWLEQFSCFKNLIWTIGINYISMKFLEHILYFLWRILVWCTLTYCNTSYSLRILENVSSFTLWHHRLGFGTSLVWCSHSWLICQLISFAVGSACWRRLGARSAAWQDFGCTALQCDCGRRTGGEGSGAP